MQCRDIKHLNMASRWLTDIKKKNNKNKTTDHNTTIDDLLS